jgi:peptide chain release factor 1
MSDLHRHLDALAARHRQSTERLADPGFAGSSEYPGELRRHARLSEVVEPWLAWRAAERELGELEALRADPEMRSLAEEEAPRLRERQRELLATIEAGVASGGEADRRPAVIEIRAGTGGDEAALFVRDLYEMYRRFGAEIGWEFEVMDASPTQLGGFKELIFGVSVDAVFRKLCHESGGHRVQSSCRPVLAILTRPVSALSWSHAWGRGCRSLGSALDTRRSARSMAAMWSARPPPCTAR